ncbi:MAG TPA: hypothetical protein VF601_19170 [Beijerinckiaceae bacterium]|jgi:hypothetical protein
MKAPKTEHWRAIEEHWDLPGAASLLPGKLAAEAKKLLKPQDLLVVTGLVTLGNTNLHPRLSERKPQGINPAILQLDLTIKEQGTGNTVVHKQQVMFLKLVECGQYRNVEVFYENKKIADVPVVRGEDLPERKQAALAAKANAKRGKVAGKAKPSKKASKQKQKQPAAR